MTLHRGALNVFSSTWMFQARHFLEAIASLVFAKPKIFDKMIFRNVKQNEMHWYVKSLNCTTNLRVGMGLKWAAEVFFPEGCVLSLSLTIPNLVWFSRALFCDVCSQLQAADRKGATIRQFVWACVTCLSEVCTESFPYFRVYSSIIKLAHDALKELVEINSCEYDILVATHLYCII